MAVDNERAKALIAALLSTEGRTEDEAVEARKMATRMMLKHGLTEDQIKTSHPDMHRVTLDLGRYDWLIVKHVGRGIGELFGCEHWFNNAMGTGATGRTDRKAYHYAGFRPDVEQAEWLLNYILVEGRKGAKAFKGDRPKGDYLVAFASTIQRRLTELNVSVMEAVAETESLGALVIVKDAQVQTYMAEELGITGLRASKSAARKIKTSAAMAKGVADGQAVDLGRKGITD